MMCRIILANGEFRADDIVDAALAMSAGLTADHEMPEQVHRDGWGAVWLIDPQTGTLGVHRDVQPIGQSIDKSPVRSVRSKFLAIHSRRASLENNRGLKFTHPLERKGDRVTWYFMHNGFLPNVYQLLGLNSSEFDTAEYFDYIVPRDGSRISREEVLSRLEAIPDEGCLSGNAVAVNSERAYLIHWFPEPNPYPRYFGMYQLKAPRVHVIASEVIPAIAPHKEWEPLTSGEIIEFTLS